MSFLGIKNPFRTGAGAATQAATDAVASRQGRAANLTSLIDNTFSDPSREAGRQDFMEAMRSQLADTTNREFTNLSRNTKFATARQGLTGGSADLARQRRNLEDLFRQRIGDESKVQDAGSDLRTRDLATKQSLIGQAYGTADIGQDAMRGLIGQRTDLATSMARMLPNALYQTGNSLAGAYGRRAEMDAFRRGIGNGSQP
jgi:hypothetical protein